MVVVGGGAAGLSAALPLAAARIPVALASNLTAMLKDFKKQGVFVLGLDGDGDVQLPALELADRLPEDVDRLGLQGLELVKMAGHRVSSLGVTCRPHSVFAHPAQRPDRGSSPGATRRVHGSQPIDGYPSSSSQLVGTPWRRA